MIKVPLLSIVTPLQVSFACHVFTKLLLTSCVLECYFGCALHVLTTEKIKKQWFRIKSFVSFVKHSATYLRTVIVRTYNLSKNCRTFSSCSKGAAADVHGRRSSHWGGGGGGSFNFMPSSSFFRYFMPSSSFFRSNCQKLPTHCVVLVMSEYASLNFQGENKY